MNTRKTFEVKKLIKMINAFNERSDIDQDEARKTGNAILNSILHDTGNYHGFRYLNVKEAMANEPGQPSKINYFLS